MRKPAAPSAPSPDDDPESQGGSPGKESGFYGLTRWTFILEYNRQKEGWEKAADGLVAQYRPLVLQVIKGRGIEDAEDACSEFFGKVFFGKLVAKADPARGRFRALLGKGLSRFLIDRYRRQRHDPIKDAAPLDANLGEEAIQHEIDLGVAQTVVEKTMAALRAAYGKDQDQLVYLIGEKSDLPLAEVAELLGTTVGALKQRRREAKARLRQLFLREVREIALPGEAQAEAQYLLSLYVASGAKLDTGKHA